MTDGAEFQLLGLEKADDRVVISHAGQRWVVQHQGDWGLAKLRYVRDSEDTTVQTLTTRKSFLMETMRLTKRVSGESFGLSPLREIFTCEERVEHNNREQFCNASKF